MATYSRQLLSGTPANGRVIPVAATGSPGTTIHTALAGVGGYDEIYIWATNTSGSAVVLTIEFGGVTSPGDHIVSSLSIPANSPPIPIVTGQVLQNSLVVKAFAATTNVINISGYVNRIS
jgi:hypothetical protein